MSGVQMNDLGRYTAPRRWNRLTRMCYKRGCMCEGCEYCSLMKNYYKGCQAKAAVLETVRLFGAPFKRKNAILKEVVKS